MIMKYIVASRRTTSKMLGTPGYLPIPGLLAVKKMITNARTSMMSQHRGEAECEARQYFRGEIVLKGEGAPKESAILTKRSSPNRHCS